MGIGYASHNIPLENHTVLLYALIKCACCALTLKVVHNLIYVRVRKSELCFISLFFLYSNSFEKKIKSPVQQLTNVVQHYLDYIIIITRNV